MYRYFARLKRDCSYSRVVIQNYYTLLLKQICVEYKHAQYAL